MDPTNPISQLFAQMMQTARNNQQNGIQPIQMLNVQGDDPMRPIPPIEMLAPIRR